MNANLLINADSHYIPLADSSVDLVFTSPPFKDQDVPIDYWLAYKSWMRELFRVASKAVLIIHSSTKLQTIVNMFPADRIMVWSKGIIFCSYRWSPIFVYGIPPYKVNKYIWCDAFGIASITNKWKVHKYQDPLMLYQTIIAMFKDCQTVLDPFAGSGTTGEACKILGRQFIGMDILPSYLSMAANRIMSVQEPIL